MNPKVIVDFMNERVTNEMNESLLKDFSEKEVSGALFQIGPLKAPGSMDFRLDSSKEIGARLNKMW